MKRISFFLAAVALTSCVSALSFGQNRQVVTSVVPSVTFEILDQPDSPLNISIDEKLAARVTYAPLMLTNNASTPVNAFVLRIGGDRHPLYNMVFLGQGIAPGAFHVLSGVSFTPESADRPVISIDYVRFIDGKSWGADELGKSKAVRSFLDGRALALSRLNELLAGQDDTDFIKSLDIFRSSSSGMSVYVGGRLPRSMDLFAQGYKEIINILRRMPTMVDEAQDLARKLELMPNPARNNLK